MKRSGFILILIGLSLIFIASILSLFNYKKLIKPFYNNDNYEEKQVTINPTEEFNKIYIDTDNQNVNVVETNDTFITITYYESNDEKYKTSQDSSYFKLKKETKIRFFNMSMNFGDLESKSIEIKIPKDLVLDLDIDTSNAKISLSNNTYNNIVLDSSNGGIYLDNIVSNDINIKTSNGRINLNNINSISLYAKTSNGGIYLDKAIIENKAELKTSNGKIDFEISGTNDIKFTTSNASIKGTVLGLYSDYNKSLKTSNSNIEMDNQEYGKEFNQKGLEKDLYLKTSNGKIDINFTK